LQIRPNIKLDLPRHGRVGYHRPTGKPSIPVGIGKIPAGIVSIPTGTGRIPTGIDLIPTGTGTIPTGIERIPTGIGLIPTGIIKIPVGKMIIPVQKTLELTGFPVKSAENRVFRPTNPVWMPETGQTTNLTLAAGGRMLTT
jgi:hypothetical protein